MNIFLEKAFSDISDNSLALRSFGVRFGGIGIVAKFDLDKVFSFL